jgi:tetratricopeptide (TPR) repeat protein/tRNA A-37 threonylcarbamoyl transferase component Bud32
MAAHGSDANPSELSDGRIGTTNPDIASGPPGNAPASASSPSAADRYEQLDEIAHGGMGIVYRAADIALGREVALKVLKDQFAPDSATARRFLDEARIAGQLQHPGIPPIHDVGTRPDGRPFLAMKLIKGSTLDELLRDRTDPTVDRGRFVAAFEQICQAVAFAHAHKVIHRDLKPHNVMVGAFGEVQVMDWGLAKVLSAGSRRAAPSDETMATEIRSLRESDGAETQAGSVLGTPAFMPPEQAVGAIDQVDERSDVFGLGAILAVILTGNPPFQGDTAESTRVLAARGKVADCFARLDHCRAEPDLIALCKRCLSPEKADRPRDAGEVARAVAGLRAEADERARQAELERVRAESEAREQRKRRRVQAALGAALTFAVALVAFGLWWEDRQTTRRQQEEADARNAARERLEGALDRAAAAFHQDRLADADAALDRAGELLDPADASDLRSRYDELRADRATVAELDKVWARANALLDNRVPGTGRRSGELRFDEDAARTGYPAALAACGLTVGKDHVAEAAEQIGRSAIRERLIAALDDWLPVATADDRPWLSDLLAQVDPEEARNEIRRAFAEPKRLATLFHGRLPAPEALRLAARAARSPAVPSTDALPALRAVAASYPNDFALQYAAGLRSLRADPAEAVRYFWATNSLRPNNLAAIYGLATALHHTDKPGEAASYYLQAATIDPGFASAYLNLADAIKLGADNAAAVVHFRGEIERHPQSAMAHFGLGMVLRDRDPKAAATAFRKSIALDDTFAMAHNYLGYVLMGRAPIDEPIRCYQRACELDPQFAFPHYNLANALRAKGDVPGAVAEFNKALELFPEHTFSHHDLGITLAMRNDFKGAELHLRRVLEINPNFTNAYFPLGQILLASNKVNEAVEHWRTCVRRFPTWYVGYDGLLLALGRQGMHVEAVRTFNEAVLRAEPTWPEAAWHQLRYNAACSAVLASAGAGRNAPPPADRPPFRAQALAWLRTELTSHQKAAGTGPAAHSVVQKIMKHWLSDADLVSVRDPAAVGQLPQAERDAWNQLWADVRQLQTTTAPSSRP